MIELLFLLLPVAAASGWYAARRAMRNQVTPAAATLSSHYFKGLNYLLNEQPDKAIEVFIQMLEVDSETVETHLALGNLFRRRGEVDRAIRIHQNIIARPSLDKQQRALALYELAQDYMRAGLLDRAENLFSELIEIGEYQRQALAQLAEIYEQEKDWSKAINAAHGLEKVDNHPLDGVVAHYYCEMAESALHAQEYKQAEKLLESALDVDANCVRASMLTGDLRKARGECKAALKAYRKVEEQDADYLPDIVGRMRECCHDDDEVNSLMSYLQQVIDKHGGFTSVLALAELIHARDGEPAASEFIIEQLRKRPSVRGLDRLIEYSMANAEPTVKENLSVLNDLMKRLLEGRPVYKCRACGFEAKALHWHCPTCKRWDTVKPIQGVIGE